MKIRHLSILLVLTTIFGYAQSSKKESPKIYNPTVESLQQYETPDWFSKAKFGIWVCWNAYTVPAVGDWYARNMYIEGHPHYNFHLKNYGHPSKFGYKDIVNEWKGEDFDAQSLVDLFVEIGAKYIVAMANHHDNFDLWNSKYHKWNSVNYGPKRDIMAEFHQAVLKYKDKGIRWGVTSHVERASSWFQTNKGADKKGPYAGVPYDGNDAAYWDFYLPPNADGDVKPTQPSNAPTYWKENWLARCKDLFEHYEPDFFYVDGGVPFPGDDKGRTGLEMISNLYTTNAARHNGENEAVMCIKDWYAKAPKGEWGYYWDGIATLNLERARLPLIRKKPWQTDTSIGDWTYVKDDEYRSATEILQELIDIVSKNGNMLLNVSPMSNGQLDNKAILLLKEIGAWMKVNGESIYETTPWATSGVGNLRIVKKGEKSLYLSLMEMPTGNKLNVPYLVPKKGKSLGIKKVSILGRENVSLKWNSDEESFNVEIPKGIELKHALVIKIELDNLKEYSQKAVAKLDDCTEQLTDWWKNQSITESDGVYKRITVNNQNEVWAIKSDNSLVEIKNGKEIDLGFKALDVGASAGGTVFVGMDNIVYLYTKNLPMWVDLPSGENRVTRKSKDEKEWLMIPGIKAIRCDISTTGTIWAVQDDHTIAYYADLIWKKLDKKAEDIACGGGWLGMVAIINNGQLERFEGTYWEKLGGKDLIALDISNLEKNIVCLSSKGKISIYNLIGMVELEQVDKNILDISCGLKDNKETVSMARSSILKH